MTSVTKDVVSDLLPVYLAGEASNDTKALVEEFLAHNPELRDQVSAHRAYPLPSFIRPEVLESLEMTTLDRTRRLLNRKAWLLAFAMLFSLIPMSFEVKGGKIVYLLARDAPVAAIAWLVVALVGWVAYLDTCRQLSATGLQPSRGRRTRFLWALTGTLLGCSVMLVVWNWVGNAVWLRAIPPVCMFAALRLGEHWRQIERRAR
jgi:hypothetical protein